MDGAVITRTAAQMFSPTCMSSSTQYPLSRYNKTRSSVHVLLYAQGRSQKKWGGWNSEEGGIRGRVEFGIQRCRGSSLIWAILMILYIIGFLTGMDLCGGLNPEAP